MSMLVSNNGAIWQIAWLTSSEELCFALIWNMEDNELLLWTESFALEKSFLL